MEYVDLTHDLMPALGLGTWQLQRDRCRDVVGTALALGYRHIDTAQMYGNEVEVGKAIAESGVGRDDLFIATKLANDRHDPTEARRALEESLDRLGLHEVDLFMVHWPVDEAVLAATLAELAILQGEGLCRHLGVSNFLPAQLDVARSHAPIEVHQLEWHPYLHQSEMLAASRRHGLAVTAYSPLARGEVADDPALVGLAAERGATPVQVCLRWLLDHDRTAAVPKCSTREHLEEALGVFAVELDDDARRRVSRLERGQRMVDPSFAPW